MTILLLVNVHFTVNKCSFYCLLTVSITLLLSILLSTYVFIIDLPFYCHFGVIILILLSVWCYQMTILPLVNVHFIVFLLLLLPCDFEFYCQHIFSVIICHFTVTLVLSYSFYCQFGILK